MRDDLLGSKVPAFEVRIDPTQTRYFLEATGEQLPDYAEEGWAPPTSLFGPAREGYPEPLAFMGTSFEKAVMASAEYDIVRPPRVGEVLTCTGLVTDVTSKDGPKGPMTFATLEATFTDAEGGVVAVERLTFLERG